MKSFIEHSMLLGVAVMIGLVFAIPAIGELVFSDMLPERWQFLHWPIWLQIPFGTVIALYVFADARWTIRPPGKQGDKTVRRLLLALPKLRSSGMASGAGRFAKAEVRDARDSPVNSTSPRGG